MTALHPSSRAEAPTIPPNLRGINATPVLDATNELWRPSYGEYDRELSLARYDALVGNATLNGEVDPADVAKGYEFIHQAFDSYEGVGEVTPASFAFTVPTRTSAADEIRNGSFAAEVAPFIPILNSAHVPPLFIERWGTSLPPTIIERYQPNGDGDAGAVVYAPISPDIIELYDAQNPMEVLRVARKIVQDTVDFAVDRLQVSAVGLGATLPALTNLGRVINTGDNEVALTTGHAGTVHLIAETAQRLHESHIEYDGKFGIIGVGAIGSATAQALLDRYPDATFIVNDQIENNVDRLKKALGSERVQGVSSAQEVVAGANTIISAVTSDFQLAEGDYTGKAFIEDSMPTCVPQATIEAGGGTVVWVIGDDQSQDGILTPTGLWEPGGYRYGGSFASHRNLFGCAGEVAVISASGDKNAALRRGVKPADVRRIGAMFKQFGFIAAQPQRAGQLLTT